MRGSGQGGDGLDVAAEGSVGGVDDAQRRLAAGDQGEGGADVVGWGEAGFYRVPQAEVFERLAGLDASGNMGWVAQRQPTGRAEDRGDFGGGGWVGQGDPVGRWGN